MEKYLNIPKTIIAGYRQTDKRGLIYLTYINELGEIAKQKSWNDWRSKVIEPEQFNNEPIEGIKIIGGGGGKPSYSKRQAYCQILDPRGFEVQISFDNLLYLLNFGGYAFDKKYGTGYFDMKCVYAWDGSTLILCPIDSPDYKYVQTINNSKRYNPKECEVGNWYKMPNSSYDMLYIGDLYRLKYISDYNPYFNKHVDSEIKTKVEKKYIFVNIYSETNFSFTEYNASLVEKSKLIRCNRSPEHKNIVQKYIDKYYNQFGNKLHGSIKKINSISINTIPTLRHKITEFVNLTLPDELPIGYSDETKYGNNEFIRDSLNINKYNVSEKNSVFIDDDGSIILGDLHVTYKYENYNWYDYKIKCSFSGEKTNFTFERFKNHCEKNVYFVPKIKFYVKNNKLKLNTKQSMQIEIPYEEIIKHGHFEVAFDNFNVHCEDKEGELTIKKSFRF